MTSHGPWISAHTGAIIVGVPTGSIDTYWAGTGETYELPLCRVVSKAA